MGNIKNIEGKGFDKNPQNINKKGRPPKLISGTIKKMQEDGYFETTKEEVKSVYLRLINMESKKIQQIMDDDNEAMLIRIVAKEVLSDRGFEIIEKLLDRAIGKVEQSSNINHTNDGGKFDDIPPINISIDSKDIELK